MRLFLLIMSIVFAQGALWAAFPAIASESGNCPRSVDVRDVMTVREFNQAGLNKLDKQQLAALNAWLSRYIRASCAKPGAEAEVSLPAPVPAAAGAGAGAGQAGQTSPAAPASTRATGKTTAPSPTSAEIAAFGSPPSQKPKEPGRIESRIHGVFHGWTGNTVFRLENGQVWKQAGPGYFRVDLKNPKVLIKKLLIGYVLLVEGYSKEVFVRRIR